MAISLLSVVSLCACRQKGASPSSAQFHGNERHTGVYEQTGRYNTTLPLNWKFKGHGKIFSSPAVANGLVYAGSEDGNLYAIDIASGTLQWTFHTNGAVSSSPCVYKNLVYFLSYDGHVYAVDAKSGKAVWTFKTGGEKKAGAYGLWTMKPANLYMEDLYDFFLSSPVIETGNTQPTLYVGSSDGNLYALNALDGSLSWTFATGGIIHTSPAVYHNTVYVTSWDTYLYAIDAVTGKEKWRFKTNDQPVYHLLEGIQASPAIADSLVYFGARDSYFYAVNATTGDLVWKFFNDNSWVVTTAAVRDSTVYFGTSDTYLLLALDAKTGKERYRVQADGYVYSSPAIAGNKLYFADFTGRLFGLDLYAGEKPVPLFSTAARNANAAAVLNKHGRLDFLYSAGNDDPINYSTAVKVMQQFYSLGSIVSSPVISGNQLFFGSADSCLYALALTGK